MRLLRTISSVFSAIGVATTAAPIDGPLAPERALATFDTEPGLRVELVAAEPLVVAPCAVAWDESGRLFVAENRGYPLGGPNGEPLGRIAMLSDTNRDGRMDTRIDFATGLTYPNGLLPWRGGLIVTCAPEVFFFKDTDGDGRADVKEILLTGFATNQSTQLRVNKPMLALDGWVYLASGLSSGKITSPKRPAAPALELKGDLRFKPDTGEYEATDGKSQFGQSFDDFGRRFGVFNRVQVQHFVLPSHYVSRHPHLTSPGVMQNCPELLENPFMRGGGGAARIYPISANITTADSHLGTFSAACAIHLWRGGALPERYLGGAFTCDPTGNLVHFDRLESSGATFAARRVGESNEFLRSPDNWFRPCYLATGPDGALYICDMYRKTIEHPEYLPVEVRKRTDFDSGKDMGRLWRVGSSKFKAQSSKVEPRGPADWARALGAENAWERDTAFRMLVERGDKSLAAQLESAFAAETNAVAASAQLHLLTVWKALKDTTLARALGHSSPRIREIALKLSEPRFVHSAELRQSARALADDGDARVRFQCALALGYFGETGIAAPLARIAARAGDDRWTRAAVLSSASDPNDAYPLLSALARHASEGRSGLEPALRELARMMTARSEEWNLYSLLDWMFRETAPAGFDAQAAVLTGFAERAKSGNPSNAAPALLRYSAGSDAGTQSSITDFLQQAARVATDGQAPEPRRLSAIQLLAHTSYPLAGSALESAIASDTRELSLAAVRSLTALDDPRVPPALLRADRWQRYTPALREAVIASLLARATYHPGLLDAIESGAIPAGALSSDRRNTLLKSKHDAVRQRAESLLQQASGGDRMKAFESAKACLTLKPVAANGRAVFSKLCANCHRLEQEGVAVGPDLFDIRNQPKESILLHIVVPEHEIAPQFATYHVETRDGRTLSGILLNETPGAVTLRQALAVEDTIPRHQIATLTASKLSLMPQELEKGMTPQELADLLAYLKGEP